MNFQTGKHKMFHIFESFHLNWLGRAQKSSGKAEALVYSAPTTLQPTECCCDYFLQHVLKMNWKIQEIDHLRVLKIVQKWLTTDYTHL